jgi:indole-3-glycerol phosphate synthase
VNILDKIVEFKRGEVSRLKRQGISDPPRDPGPTRGFASAVTRKDPGEPLRIIAEAKKASPSKGLLCPDFDPVALARDYQEAGASAMSVLTDEEFFQGSLAYLMDVRRAVDLPLLRKDFIIDHIQIDEARRWGADAVLLIAAILSTSQISEFLAHAQELSLACLVEVHDEDEAEKALSAGAALIGINNRNLKDFSVSLDTTVRVKGMIPDEIPVVSESGIRSGEDARYLKEHGVSALLIGESLVTSDDRIGKLKQFLV